MKIKSFLFWVSVLVSVGTNASAQESNHGKTIYAKSVLNQQAPEIQVEKWLTAKPNTKGKFVLVDFWATWCGPCRRFIPTLNSYQKLFKDKLVVIGLSNETEDVVHKMKSPVIEYAEAIDPLGRTAKELSIRGIPHVILIDPHGIVRWEGFPAQSGFELSVEEVQRLIETYD